MRDLMKKRFGIMTVLFALMLVWAGCGHDDKDVPVPDNSNKESGNSEESIDTASIPIVVKTGDVLQSIDGFGGANIVEWTGDLTSDQRVTAFSPEEGIGLSIVRLRVPVNQGNFAENKATADACRAYGGKVIAAAWTAPAGMKTNNNAVGGKLKPGSYEDFAAHLRAFSEAVGGLDYISPTNEPNIDVDYESMRMTPQEVADFVAQEGDNLGAPVMAPEPFDMNNQFISQYVNVPEAYEKTAVIAGHIYGAKPYSLEYTQRPVWMTEHYTNSSISGNDWNNAMVAAKEIHDCMTAGWSAYIWWYIRREYGPIGEDGSIQKVGYVMSQYARDIRPGFERISATENPENGVYATAYKDGEKVVMVLLNQNEEDVYQKFSVEGEVAVNGFNAYQTTKSANWESKEVDKRGSGFGVRLGKKSILTLVSE